MSCQPPGCPPGFKVKRLLAKGASSNLPTEVFMCEIVPLPADAPPSDSEISDTDRLEHIRRHGLPNGSWSNFREWIDEDIRYQQGLEDAKAAMRGKEPK